MRVDQVEAAPAMQPRHAVAHAQGHERRGQTHPEPRHDRVARVMNIDPGYHLGSRDSRELRVASETRIRAREPWHRRDHRRLDLARREQLLQAAQDEETVGRLLGIGKETGKRQDAQRTLARQTGGGARTSRAGFPYLRDHRVHPVACLSGRATVSPDSLRRKASNMSRVQSGAL